MFSIALVLFLISLLGTLITIRSIISIARSKHLFDEPSEVRKIHISRTPNLGGVGMYCTFIFSVALIIPNNLVQYFNSFIAGSMIIFSIGLKDDLIGLGATKKFIAQIFAALIMAYIGDVRISSLHGIFGIYEIAYPLSILLTVFINIFIYNSFNLIDGVDGLAGSLGLVGSLTFAICFYLTGAMGDFLLCIGFAAVLIGFLYYNISPAKTFMGDTGSLFTGFMLALFSIRFIEVAPKSGNNFFFAPIGISLAILIIPIFDTIRVFIFRIIRGKSPFLADSNHLHHRFLHMGFTHIQTTLIISGTTLCFIVCSFLFQKIGNTQSLIFLIILSIMVYFFFWAMVKREKKQTKIRGFKDESIIRIDDVANNF
eukprot:TRINITY_DN6913_c0_g2_i2.p1 TRINITY_DN6913_c0_g2~~TRINITY_DN6913_c0_g2_i2.p1  ORF type:complete len:370 (-),score=-64.98 TRINITY_DN6913_c0_g2_i2:317-1426(-)